MAERMDLSRVGEFEGEYQLKQQRVRPVGFVTKGLETRPDVILKLYEMAKAGEDFYSNTQVGNIRDFVRSKFGFGRGELDRLSGIGFAIISKGMVNVARWGIDILYLPVNRLYEFKEMSPPLTTFRVVNSDKEGAFCGWEIGIVDFETKRWFEFLRSPRKDDDKRRYLEARIEGDLHK